MNGSRPWQPYLFANFPFPVGEHCCTSAPIFQPQSHPVSTTITCSFARSPACGQVASAHLRELKRRQQTARVPVVICGVLMQFFSGQGLRASHQPSDK